MSAAPALEPAAAARVECLLEEGRQLWDGYERARGEGSFTPFVPADYDMVLRRLVQFRAPGQRFLEWGSANGVITILADLLGYEAYGIELDGRLVRTARELAKRHGSGAVFVEGSFLPEGYRWRPDGGDGRTGTIGEGPSGYLRLGRPLEDFDLVYGYPWPGEEPLMRDLMRRYGAPGARLVLSGPGPEAQVFQADRAVA